MRKVTTAHYSQYELFTRQGLFSKLTGALRFPQFDGGECDAVLLNFETDRFSASETFSELKKNGLHVIVYTDRFMSPIIKKQLMDYDRCSLIIRPEEYEVEKARQEFEKNGIYRTIAANEKKELSVPMADGSVEKLTTLQTGILYCLLCGMNQKEMADEVGTTRETVTNVIYRLKKIFGGCLSTTELIANVSVAF